MAMFIAAFFFIASQAMSIADAVRQVDLEHLMEADRVAREDDYRMFEQAVEEGAQIESELSCENISSQLPPEVTKAHQVLAELFRAETVSETLESVAMQTTEEIVALAAAADKRKCLPQVLAGPVQSEIAALLSSQLGQVLAASSDYGTESLHLAYQRLIAWQQGSLDLAGPDLKERTILFQDDIEANCPAPCGMCSKEHNSMRKGEELFKFKCLLHRGESPPTEPGLACTPPRRRRSFWRPHRWGRKSWCTVEPWQRAACQKLRVTTMMSCGTELILQPLLHHWNASSANNFASQTYFDCVKWETTLASFGSMHYRYGHKGFRATIPLRNQLGFRMIMSLGLANGLAALRDKSSSSPLNPPIDFVGVFLQRRTPDTVLRRIFNGNAHKGGRRRDNGDEAFSVLSVENVLDDSIESGRFFNFDVARASGALGKALSNDRVYEIDQYRDGGLIRSGKAIFWTYADGGSVGNGHGRFHPNSGPGQWRVGDTIQIHEVDIEGDISRSCPLLIADMDRCRPAWKNRMDNFPIHAWRFTYTLGSMFQYSILFAGMAFLLNAISLASLGMLLGKNLFVGGWGLYLTIVTSAAALLGAATGWEAWVLKDYGFTPSCDVVGAPRGRTSWTELLEDAREHAGEQYNETLIINWTSPPSTPMPRDLGQGTCIHLLVSVICGLSLWTLPTEPR